jgi:oxygen-independent coproporphyrinogen-3 oxidase
MSRSPFSLVVKSVRAGTPYAAYSYSYPHKTAYRPIMPSLNLRSVWADEGKDALFFYTHLPFCEMRCGFCNLFTTPNPHGEVVDLYLDVLERQFDRVAQALGRASFARGAIGGGTPTYLSAAQLDRLFDFAARAFALDPRRVPMSVETSPRTADDDKLAVLKRRGVSRISIGVQSMIDGEVNAAGRAQRQQWVSAAIDRIRAHDFATLNVDLIYGLPGQTTASWRESLVRVLRFEPDELYLYPLYVRPLTGLDRRGAQPGDELRLNCYREARQTLLSSGYEQLSMRMFRATRARVQAGPVYCCQEDGMVGLGCGARSYTRSLHYSSEYAVGASGVKAILGEFLAKTDTQLEQIDYGCMLDAAEQKRRYAIKSLLRSEGLDGRAYAARFASEVIDDIPEIANLIEDGLVETGDMLRLTDAGMERSDAIGPYLYSDSVKRMMDAYEFQ